MGRCGERNLSYLLYIFSHCLNFFYKHLYEKNLNDHYLRGEKERKKTLAVFFISSQRFDLT